MHLGIVKKSGFCVVFHAVLWIATEVKKGTRRSKLHKPPPNRLCLRPPLTTVSVLRLSLHLTCPS